MNTELGTFRICEKLRHENPIFLFPRRKFVNLLGGEEGHKWHLYETQQEVIH